MCSLLNYSEIVFQLINNFLALSRPFLVFWLCNHYPTETKSEKVVQTVT